MPEDKSAPAAVPGDAATIREVTKWLLGGFAGLAALILAGVQVSDVISDADPVWIALSAYFAALAAAVAVMFAAARVLLPGYSSLRPIALAYTKAQALEASGRPRATGEDLFGELARRWRELCKTSRTANAPDLSNELNAGYDKRDELRANPNATVNWRGAAYTNDNVAAFDSALALVAEDSARVVSAANDYVVRQRYGTLIHVLIGASIVVAVSVPVAGLVGSSDSGGSAKSVAVTGPIAVTLVRSGDSWPGALAGCNEKKLVGVIVGGTLQKPVVAVDATGVCGPAVIDLSDVSGVVPIPATAKDGSH